MQKIVVLLLVLLALATPVSASNVMGWTGAVIAQNAIQASGMEGMALLQSAQIQGGGGHSSGGVSVVNNGTSWVPAPFFSDIFGLKEEEVELGLNVTMTSSMEEAGMTKPDATFQGTPAWVSVPRNYMNLAELDKFAYFTYTLTYADRRINNQRVDLEAQVKQGCLTLCDRISCINCNQVHVKVKGLAPGIYAVTMSVVNTLGKKHFYMNLVFVQASVSYGRVTHEDDALFYIEVFDERHALDSYCQLEEGAEDYDGASKECKRLARQYLMEYEMPGWKLTERELKHDFMEPRMSMKRKGLALPLEPEASTDPMEALDQPQGGPVQPAPTPPAPSAPLAVPPQAPAAPAQPLAAPAPAPTPPAPVKDPQPKVHLLNYVSNTTTSAKADPSQIAFSFTVIKDGKACNGQDIALRFYGAEVLAGASTDGKIWAHAERSDIGQNQWYMVYQNGKPVGNWNWFVIKGDGDAFNLNLVTAQEVAAR